MLCLLLRLEGGTCCHSEHDFKICIYFYFEWTERRLAPLLVELLKLKVGKHPVTCTDGLYHLLKPGRGFQPLDLQTGLHIHFDVIVRNKRENKEEHSKKSP